MDPLVVIKDCLINMIDHCEERGTVHETLRQLHHYFDLFVENDYAYKGSELCNRLMMIGGWSQEFRQEISDLGNKYDRAHREWSDTPFD